MPEEPVTTQEPGSYPAIAVHKYRDGPIEDRAVHYVQSSKLIVTKATRNRQQEDNIRSAELDFMLDLETLINETAADPDPIEVQCCIEDENILAIPGDYKHVVKKFTQRWGITKWWMAESLSREACDMLPSTRYTMAIKEQTKCTTTQSSSGG